MRRVTVPGAPDRWCLAAVPDLVPPGGPTIVLGLHGSRSGAAGQGRLSRMDRLTGRGAIVVFPEGSLHRGFGRAWDLDDDAAYLVALIETLLLQYGPTDPRVVVAGMSGGARMACHLASLRPDLVRAVGAVGGLRAPSRLPLSRPVPVVAFHGTADRINPYRGHARGEWIESVPEAADAWARANGTQARALTDVVANGVRRTRYGDAGGPGEVALYTIDGGGHTWPGGYLGFIGGLLLGRTSREIDATELIWAFAMEHGEA